MSSQLEVRVDIRALVGEGPLWDEEEEVLYWIDILSNRLYVYDPATDENRSYDVGQHVGTVVCRASGGVMLAVRDGFAAFDLAGEALTIINDPEADLPNNRFNDGKCDPGGRFWAGTMAYSDQSTQGSLYRLDPDMSVHRMLGDIGISNGIIWSLDQTTMYYADTIANTVRAFDYDLASGNISRERVVIRPTAEMGPPDGLTLDSEGMIWLAHYGGGCVRRWDPETGQVLQTVELPTRQITACAFGDKDLDTLYITSAAQQMDQAALEREPLAGSLFSIKTGHQGVPSFKFAG